MNRRDFITLLVTATAGCMAQPVPQTAPSMVVDVPAAQSKSYSQRVPKRTIRVGYHEHVCSRGKCGRAWSHPDGSRYYGAHSCPSCGRDQYEQSRSWVVEREAV